MEINRDDGVVEPSNAEEWQQDGEKGPRVEDEGLLVETDGNGDDDEPWNPARSSIEPRARSLHTRRVHPSNANPRPSLSPRASCRRATSIIVASELALRVYESTGLRRTLARFAWSGVGASGTMGTVHTAHCSCESEREREGQRASIERRELADLVVACGRLLGAAGP